MKVVFLTSKNSHGAALLTSLKTHNILITAILIEKGSLASLMAGSQRNLSRYGVRRVVSKMWRKVRRRIRPAKRHEWRKDAYYREFSNRVITVDDFNSEACRSVLEQIQPDIMVLGGTRIFRDPILSIPRICTLNAHPGLLPAYRGVDVIPWAILNGDDIGVTIHCVDRGVDTGQICRSEKIAIEPGDTLVTLKHKSQRVAGRLMAETVHAILDSGKVETQPNPANSGKQYYRMDQKTRKQAERQLEIRKKALSNPVA